MSRIKSIGQYRLDSGYKEHPTVGEFVHCILTKLPHAWGTIYISKDSEIDTTKKIVEMNIHRIPKIRYLYGKLEHKTDLATIRKFRDAMVVNANSAGGYPNYNYVLVVDSKINDIIKWIDISTKSIVSDESWNVSSIKSTAEAQLIINAVRLNRR